MLIRLHRSEGEQRQQLRLIALAAALPTFGVIWLLVVQGGNGDEQTWAASLPLFVSYFLLPILFAIADPATPALRARRDHQPHDRGRGGGRVRRGRLHRPRRDCWAGWSRTPAAASGSRSWVRRWSRSRSSRCAAAWSGSPTGSPTDAAPSPTRRWPSSAGGSRPPRRRARCCRRSPRPRPGRSPRPVPSRRSTYPAASRSTGTWGEPADAVGPHPPGAPRGPRARVDRRRAPARAHPRRRRPAAPRGGRPAGRDGVPEHRPRQPARRPCRRARAHHPAAHGVAAAAGRGRRRRPARARGDDRPAGAAADRRPAVSDRRGPDRDRHRSGRSRHRPARGRHQRRARGAARAEQGRVPLPAGPRRPGAGAALDAGPERRARRP